MTEVLNRRLFLVKSLYEHGREHSYSNTGVDKMIAVHNFHNSIELLLRTILSEKGVLKQKFITFNQMVEEVKKLEEQTDIESDISYGELFTLNELRNLVQHTGKEPSNSDLEQWRVITYQFHKKAFIHFFGLKFKKFSSLELIQEEFVRKLMQKASEEYQIYEDDLANPTMSAEERQLYQDLDEASMPWNVARMRAFCLLGIAFGIVYSKAIIALDDYTWGLTPTIYSRQIESIHDNSGLEDYREFTQGIGKDFWERKISFLEADLRLRNLNIDPVKFWTFNLFLPRVYKNFNDQILFEFEDQGPPDMKEVFEQFYSLAYNLIVQWQDKPNYKNETSKDGVLSSLAEEILSGECLYFEAAGDIDHSDKQFKFDLGEMIRGGFVFK